MPTTRHKKECFLQNRQTRGPSELYGMPHTLHALQVMVGQNYQSGIPWNTDLQPQTSLKAFRRRCF